MCVAWFRNYVRSSTMNNAVSNGGRVGYWIIGHFHIQLLNLNVELIDGSFVIPSIGPYLWPLLQICTAHATCSSSYLMCLMCSLYLFLKFCGLAHHSGYNDSLWAAWGMHWLPALSSIEVKKEYNRTEYIMGFSPEGPDSLRPFTSRPLVPPNSDCSV